MYMAQFTRLFGVLFIFLSLPISLWAQSPSTPQKETVAVKDTVPKLNVRGTVFEHETLQPMQGAAVKIFDEKGTMVTGQTTQKNGQFILPGVAPGKYTLKVSFMGFKEQSFSLTLPHKSGNFKVNDVLMREEATLMKEAVVEGQMPEMTVADDTIVYNADAFKLPDGSLVEDLIKKLPGIVIDEDGNYTWNGKDISQILVDGKEFFGNNKDIILKNLTAEIIDKVKAYDRQSDRARITGIDDGNEKTVLDLTIKKDKKKGWFGNGSGGYGTSDRYSGRAMMNRFKGEQKFSVLGNANNTEGNGMTDQQSGGFTVNYEKKKKLELNGTVNGKWNQDSSESSSNSQSFENKNAAYSNNYNKSSSHGNSMNMGFRVEWKPDTLTNIHFRPNFSLSGSGSESQSTNASFKNDPYAIAGITDPLAQIDEIDRKSKVNFRRGANHNSSDNLSGSASLDINRRLKKAGRNISGGIDGGFGEGNTESENFSRVDYYRFLAENGGDSIYRKTQYNDSKSKNYHLSANASYSEPIAQQLYLQFSYSYSYRFNDHDRTVSSIFDPYNEQYGVDFLNYRNFSMYGTPDVEQCNYTTNTYQNHNARVQLRLNRTQYNLTIGGNVQPQINTVDYNKGTKHYDVRQSVVNASPNVNFRYKFSRQESLRFQYGGNTGQPGITDLIPDTLSNANPLNIRLGNPNLKPSFTQNLETSYQKSIIEFQRSYSANFNFHTTQNSVSSRTEYNEETGGRVTRPENINGNWNWNASFNYNSAFRKNQKFRWNTNTQGSMTNNVSYYYNSDKETVKSRTRGAHVSEHLRFTFRNDWLEANVQGTIRYNHSRNSSNSASNLDTYTFNYGGNIVIQAPWGFTFSTDLGQHSRRGYSDESMNTNQLIWGAEISQRLLPKKNLTISVRAVDILNERDNVYRNITSTARTDTRSQMIHSYWMMHVTYRFGKFGGRNKKGPEGGDGERPRGEEFHEGGGRPGGFEGRPEGPRGGGFEGRPGGGGPGMREH